MANKRVMVMDELIKLQENLPTNQNELVKDLIDQVKLSLTNETDKLTDYQMWLVVKAIEVQGRHITLPDALFVLQIITFINSCQMVAVGDFDC